jgi:hypothetical protein
MQSFQDYGAIQKLGNFGVLMARYVLTVVVLLPLVLTWLVVGLFFQAGERVAHKKSILEHQRTLY